MRMILDANSLEDYKRFLQIKQLPHYQFEGNTAIFPDEYANRLNETVEKPPAIDYEPIDGLFDYQEDITRLAISKRKFSVFADCGLGKTLMMLEFARHVCKQIPSNKCILIVSPLMVIPQTISEAKRFYGGSYSIEQVRASRLKDWLTSGKGQIGITNYEALRDDVEQGRLAGLILDESSMLKSHYGKHGTKCIELGKGLDWKLALTGTPAPNDRIEYANHAVFMDAYPTINSFLARFFVNRGQTNNRWELKKHASSPFYVALSHWCIFLTNPATYGWSDGCKNVPPMHVHLHDVPLTSEQQDIISSETDGFFVMDIGGITSRSKLSQISKGYYKGKKFPTNKPAFIRKLIDSWPDESTIIWCLYNEEQRLIAKWFPEAASISGDTPNDERMRMIADFKVGRTKILISKPKILGFGLNLERASRQVFSGLQDSYESFYQAVKRSNRYGATRPLNVHIPVTEVERPMIQTVLNKMHRVEQDTIEQERLFKRGSLL